MKVKKAIIYARKSKTQDAIQVQSHARQINELTESAQRNGYEIVRVFADSVSGTKRIAARQEAKQLIEYITANKVACVFISEVSRLGRSAIDVQKVADKIVNELGCNIYVHQQGNFLLDDKGKFNAMTKLIFDLLANFAQMESEQLSIRIKSGQAEAIRQGKSVGRRKGDQETRRAFLDKHRDIQKYVQADMSLREIQKLTGKSINTIRKVRDAMQPTKQCEQLSIA